MAEQITIFDKIVAGEAPADIVYRDELAIAFRDVNPQAPVHVVVVPVEHEIDSLNDVSRTDEKLLGHLLYVAAKVANQLAIAENGYRVVINTGAAAGQSVEYIHVHLLGGRDLAWPPG